MDWRSVNFDWNRARAFLVTAEEGSLSAAARALGMTQPTLGRQVTALGKELGLVLFERVGQGLVLTPSGLDLLEHVRAMVLSLRLFHRLLPNLFRRKLSQLSHIRTTGGIVLEYGSVRESSSRFGKRADSMAPPGWRYFAGAMVT